MCAHTHTHTHFSLSLSVCLSLSHTYKHTCVRTHTHTHTHTHKARERRKHNNPRKFIQCPKLRWGPSLGISLTRHKVYACTWAETSSFSGSHLPGLICTGQLSLFAFFAYRLFSTFLSLSLSSLPFSLCLSVCLPISLSLSLWPPRWPSD